MGLFSGFKRTYRKSEAAVIVQNLLDDQTTNTGLFDLDPAKIANKLVDIIWDAKPDVFDGKIGRHPHKITVAAIALANGIKLFKDEDLNKTALVLSLGNILSEIETNGSRYPLKGIDHQLLEISLSIYTKFSQKLSESPLSKEIDELMASEYKSTINK